MEVDLLSIVLAVLGGAAAIWKTLDANFWKKIAKDTFDVVDVVKKARDERSPGGKELTIEEKAEIGEQSMEVIIPLWEKLSGKLKKK